MKNTKRITAVILSALMMTSAFSVLPVSAAEVESNTSAVSSYENFISGDYEYSLLDDGTIEISKYVGNDSDVTIPDEIDGKKVTSIGEWAFSSLLNLTNITIPNSVINIGNSAFSGCTNLTNITMPNSIKSIGETVFLKCQNLVNVTIPNSVTSIGTWAFSSCKSLTNITIPNSVTSVGKYAFYGCEHLANIAISNNITVIGMGAFYDTAWYNNQPDGMIVAGKVLYKYKGSMPENTKLIIPNEIVSITDEAFYDCENLSNVIIPNSVASIGNSAFYGCENLLNVTIPSSVANIGYSAFEYCENLESINIPYGIKSIEDGTFKDCSNLVNITIPETVTSIASHAFEGCMRLENISIPDSVVDIGRYAFNCTEWYDNQPDGIVFAGKILYNYKGDMPKNTDIIISNGTKAISQGAFSDCVNLRSISISNSISNISSDMFSGCTGLTNVFIPNTVTEIGYNAFEHCSSLKNINIPNSVTSIGNSAFYYCTSLENIVIPVGTKSIGSNAFYGCLNLSSVTIPNTVTSINEAVFGNCTKLKSIVIPESINAINPFAFSGCTSLKTIIIPKNVNFLGHNFIGYYYDEDSHDYLKIENFKIYGYKNTAAEKYAQDNGFEFISLADDIIFSDKSTGITVSGVMQNDAVLNVTKLENTFKNSVATYDITLQKDGAVIQPDSTITVKIPSNAENCKVMWLKDDGTAEDMNAEYTDGGYVFTTDHLSVYALVLNKTILTGDANQDGIINVNDVTYLQMHIAGKKTTDGSAFIDETNKLLFDCIDMNKDGKLTVTDVTALQIYISENN